MEEALRKEARAEAIACLNRAADAPRPVVDTLYTDVYDKLPWSLQEQRDAMHEHMDKYPEHYADIRR